MKSPNYKGMGKQIPLRNTARDPPDNLKRASAAGLAWPLAGDLTDGVLEQRLFAHAGVKRGFRRRAEPDWGSLACELKRPGVNLMVLWEEYRAVQPGGYG